MPVANSRGAPVIYVAGSARELPAEVRDWLGRAETRAVASPHLYDMLAQLARGKKFAGIIVNIQSVDWNEMDFFDCAARLRRNTPVFVTGSHQHRAKLEAACRRGARLFDAIALDEELMQAAGVAVPPSTTEYSPAQPDGASRDQVEPADRAVQAETACEPTLTRPRVKLVEPDNATVADELESGYLENEPEVETAKVADVRDAGPEWVSSPDPVFPPDPVARNADDTEFEISPPESAESQSAAVVASSPEPPRSCNEPATPAEPLREVEDALACEESDLETGPTADDLPDPEPGALSADANEARPVVRLAAASEDPAKDDRPVMFPWSAYPNRPKRIPPVSLAAAPDVPAADPVPPPSAASSESPFRSVRLTAEEISALMGQPPRRQAPEGQS